LAKTVTIVGGGTAGWITACYMARMLSSHLPTGVQITLIESEDIGIIGVGEGTFPSIRKTLKRIGLSEADMVREASATFKQGIRFNNWRRTPGPGAGEDDHYFHPFQVADQHAGLDLLPYWLLGVAGDAPWADVCTVQKRVVEDRRGPKLVTHDDYAGPLNYAYHFDAVEFARLLRKHAISLGVRHVVDDIDQVVLGADGAIDHLRARKSGEVRADLYVDCSGFRAELIGKTLGAPFRSFRDQLFQDRAVAIQIPYGEAGGPIPSYTISTAQSNGWTWDIGLHNRRGTGYVYSSAHITDEEAERTLRAYIGPAADGLPARALKFEAGFRETQWRKNCVAIGLSAGFIEPLEATGIGFAEIAAVILCGLFPWSGEYELAAKQFNAQMACRYTHVIDFIKLHYCISERRDTAFWHDHTSAATISDALNGRLEVWRHRPPSFLDVDLKHDIFTEHNWQYVLYGMGFQTDLGARAGALRFFDDARRTFADIGRQSDYALTVMPKHRDLIEQVRRHGFKPQNPAQAGRRYG
jgi:tryptophan halogenase